MSICVVTMLAHSASSMEYTQKQTLLQRRQRCERFIITGRFTGKTFFHSAVAATKYNYIYVKEASLQDKTCM